MTHFQSPIEELKDVNFWRGIIAECFSIGILVFSGSATAAGYNGHPLIDVTTAVVAGLVLGSLVDVVADISGAHINPAVTIPLMAARKCSFFRGISYVFIQCVGGIGGSAVLYSMIGDKVEFSVLKVSQSSNADTVVGLEIIFTFLMLFTVFTAIDPKVQMTLSPGQAVSVNVILGVMVTNPISPISMNPVRAFGPALVMWSWEKHWVYWLGPIAGGLLAAFMYEVVLHTPHFISKHKHEARPVTEQSNNRTMICNTPDNMMLKPNEDTHDNKFSKPCMNSSYDIITEKM